MVGVGEFCGGWRGGRGVLDVVLVVGGEGGKEEGRGEGGGEQEGMGEFGLGIETCKVGSWRLALG